MFVLITGGSGSGKSAYAEQAVMQLGRTGQKYYLATMQVYGEEGQKKVERHHRLRAGKGFETIEQPRDIRLALPGMQQSGTALLECMSNLVANEMFGEEGIISKQRVTEKILAEIRLLLTGLENLVIVTNNVFEDGCSYEETTLDYLQALGQINCSLAQMADQVVEVVVGIPVVIKTKEGGKHHDHT